MSVKEVFDQEAPYPPPLTPLHVISAAVIAAAVFVVGLILLVRWVVSSGAALN